MKILKQESETSRIVQKITFASLFSVVIARQRKVGGFWRVTAWLYANQLETIDEYVRHFDWEEDPKEFKYGKKQF